MDIPLDRAQLWWTCLLCVIEGPRAGRARRPQGPHRLVGLISSQLLSLDRVLCLSRAALRLRVPTDPCPAPAGRGVHGGSTHLFELASPVDILCHVCLSFP